MDSSLLLQQMADVIDRHSWAELPGLLHEDFRCGYVHTGEVFDRDSWVRLNAEYPGFQNFVLVDYVAKDNRAVGRAHVTSVLDNNRAFALR